MSNNHKKYCYMEYLRVICVLGVILIHVSGQKWSELDIGSMRFNTQTMYNLLGRYSTFIFCMISGALFLNPKKDFPMRIIAEKYTKRILICFGVWVVLYDILYTIMDKGDLEYFVIHLFAIPLHMWYLLMIVGLYLALPVLRQITKDRKITLYLIWLLIIFGILFGTLTSLRSLYPDSKNFSFGQTIVDQMITDISYMNVTFIPGYLGFFLLGHYIHEYGVGKWHTPLVVSAIPSLLLSGILTIVLSIAYDKPVILLMVETSPFLVLAAVGLFEFFKNTESGERKYNPDSKITKVMCLLGSYSFGIYLVHYGVMNILDRWFDINVTICTQIISVPLLVLIIFVITLVIVAILKKIPFIRAIVT